MSPAPPSACTLVIPAYNEEQRIGRSLGGLAGFGGEVVFVCDGTDATPALIEAFAESHIIAMVAALVRVRLSPPSHKIRDLMGVADS